MSHRDTRRQRDKARAEVYELRARVADLERERGELAAMVVANGSDAVALTRELAERRARVAALEEFGAKVNAIRNSIVGAQAFNWSEHAYPLVAALDAAGFEGKSYPEARAFVGTLIDRANRAEATVATLAAALDMVRDADNDCARDGLPTIPRPARAVIDAALAEVKP